MKHFAGPETHDRVEGVVGISRGSSFTSLLVGRESGMEKKAWKGLFPPPSRPEIVLPFLLN